MVPELISQVLCSFQTVTKFETIYKYINSLRGYMRLIALFVMVLSSFTVLASNKTSPVWPIINNYGNALQVQVFNSAANDISCSGSVNAYLSSGRMQSFYFFEMISKGSFASRYYSIFGVNERITHYNHSIFCYDR